MRRLGRALGDERGSILPLVAVYVLLAGALIGVTVDLTSLYLEQKRTDALADAAAAAGADGFTLIVTDGNATAALNPDDVRAQALAVLAVSPLDANLVSADTPDGVSARVTITTVWHPPLSSVFLPNGVVLGSTATARTALN